MLEVKSLKRSYGDFSVSLDLAVGPGETLTLVGPSGSGKTTALNLIAGLASPESGKIFIDGEDITSLPPWKRNISVVFQDLALFPHLDVGGNIAYGLVIKKVPKKERFRIIEESLELVRLSGCASRKIHTLSGGERQRVAIARALAGSPKVLLLDEPFSSLDAPLRKSLRREFLEIRSSSKIPCVFVTHDREEAMMLGDKTALMREGRVAETGPGKELLLSPKTEAAALFFGAGRVLPCAILGKSEKGVETSSPLGKMIIPPGSEYSPESPLLFIPGDAILPFSPGNGEGWKPFRAKYLSSLFEGSGLTLSLGLPGGKNGGEKENDSPCGDFSIPFEISVSPRTIPPPPGTVTEFWVNRNLVRFVRGS